MTISSGTIPIDRLLDALCDAARPAGESKWKFRCPAHDDRNPSGSISVAGDGTILVKCHAGCETPAVLAAMGLELKDLFAPKDQAANGNGQHEKRASKPATIFQSARDAIADLERRHGPRADAWTYHDATGQPVGVIVRWNHAHGKDIKPISKHGDGWVHRGMASPRPLYALPDVLKSSGAIYVAEGEKAAETLRSIGLTATTSPHGSSSAAMADWSVLKDRDVVILPDNGDAGREYVAKVAKILGCLGTPSRIVALPGLAEKEDAVEFIERRREDGKEDSEIVQEIVALAAIAPAEVKAEKPTKFVTLTAGELIDQNPNMRSVVIDGICREGETFNLIGGAKIGKSINALSMIAAVVTGRPWLGHATTQGDVLLIDNELHLQTLASRIRRVSEAYDAVEAMRTRLTVLSLRGKLQSLVSMGEFFRSLEPGRLKLVIVDAFYRMLPAGVDENSNRDVMGLYNLIDSYADHLGAAFGLIHHTSKGLQSEKGVTDVGAGAGSQSRAANAHLIFRLPKEDNAVVLDGVVRSFPPLAPKCLRWEFPFFTLAEGLDPADLAATTRKAKPKADSDAESARVAARTKKDRDDETKLLVALDKEDPDKNGVNYTRLRALAGLGTDSMTRAVQRLIDDSIIEEIEIEITAGKGAKRTSRGIRRSIIGSSG